ncbi:MAG: 3-phosphoshikimate 1-carboxyvinyltransferase, partial [Candidatus Omnitrophica bacterium]|nr:3-phosphoshikimate 1-carboxyvinyltransferase [Candidatus Omnitrophota bacterium]
EKTTSSRQAPFMLSLSKHERNRLIRPSTSSGRTESNVITIEPSPLAARELRVPGDFSSAAFFFAATAIVPGSSLTVRGVGLNPTRTGLLELLKRMGAKVEIASAPAGPRNDTDEWEPVGDVTVSYGELRAITVEPEFVPNVIDELPVLMAAATQAEGITRLTGVGELRVKETDRIRSMVTNLSALGARIQEHGDVVEIKGPVLLRGGSVDSCGDHRTAMAMAVAGLTASGPTRVEGSEWINISFPEFPRLLESVRRH